MALQKLSYCTGVRLNFTEVLGWVALTSLRTPEFTFEILCPENLRLLPRLDDNAIG